MVCAGAAATGLAVHFGISNWFALLLGIATVGWSVFAILSSTHAPDRRPIASPLPTALPETSPAPPASARQKPGSNSLPSGSDLLAAANESDDLLLALSANGTVRSANLAASDFFGAGGAGLVGRSIEDLLPQAEIMELFESARSGQRRESEVTITGREARCVFRLIAMPLSSVPDDPPILLWLRDITAVQSALRLGGDFVASVSHELRTPLASIKAALETLEQSVHDDPEMTGKLLAMIDTNVNRLEALTADVLRLSQLESSGQAPELAEFEVRPALDSIAVLLDPLLTERRLSLEFDIAPEFAMIRTDPRLFELIFKNLVENAGKFAFENTKIRIVARPGDAADSSEWRIIDRGVGIPIHHQARVFDRFYQVDAARTGAPKRRGTGLGLAIVQNAVRALGGTIRVESVWQQGTTMIVALPDSKASSSPSRPNSTEAVSS